VRIPSLLYKMFLHGQRPIVNCGIHVDGNSFLINTRQNDIYQRMRGSLYYKKKLQTILDITTVFKRIYQHTRHYERLYDSNYFNCFLNEYIELYIYSARFLI